MIGTILTAAAAFLATGIDEMFVLTLIFSQAKTSKQIRDVYIGQQIGMIVLLAISVLAVFGFTLISEKWIGLLGLLPMILGIRILILGDDDDDEEEEEEIVYKTSKFNSLILSVALIAIAGGAEELAIYIPYFAALNTTNLIIALITFNLLVPIWSTVCRKISSLKQIQETSEKYQRILIPIVFIGLGLFVLIENNTLNSIQSLF
jgi:cadmium resistance transport/sequestration family protein